MSANILNAILTPHYVIEVQVSDGNSVSAHNVTVLIKDVPDSPVFINLPATTSLPENTSPVIVYVVLASDWDGDNVTFFIDSDPEAPIGISDKC